MTSCDPGTLLLGRYRVIRLLHEGGMGEVYLTEAVGQSGGQFAVKVLKRGLPKNLSDRFRQEAHVLEKLRHPNIVRTHALFEYRGQLACLLDYVDGKSLAERLSHDHLIAVPEALNLIEAVLAALDYAHRGGVIHRDIKPSNILLDSRGVPLLCDFGIARQLGVNRLTVAGVSMGTPQYMSPEQIRTPLQVDHRADLYSVGIVLYEMLTGCVPFGNESTVSDLKILEQQLKEIPPDIRKFNRRLDARLAGIVHKALEKDPAQRYQGGLEFKRALEQCRLSLGFNAGAGAGQSSLDISRPGYAVYEHPQRAERIIIKTGGSWMAALQGPFWLAAHDLPDKALGVFAICAAFCAGAGYLGIWLLIGTALSWSVIPACFGNLWWARRCERRGFVRA